MYFTSENARLCGEKGNRTKRAKTEQWENIVGFLAGKGGSSFRMIMEKLSEGKPINVFEREFLKNYILLLEFHRPKLSRTELTGKDGGEINVKNVFEIKIIAPNAKNQLGANSKAS